MIYLVQNKEDLNQRLEDADEKLVVIDFFANWCGPCKIISPTLEELAVKYAEQVQVLKVNVDDCEEIALEYNVTSMPTFIFIKNKQIMDVTIGGNADRLVKNVEKYIGLGPVPIIVIHDNEVDEDAISPLDVTTEDQIAN